jgi:hypothetical protein
MALPTAVRLERDSELDRNRTLLLRLCWDGRGRNNGRRHKKGGGKCGARHSSADAKGGLANGHDVSSFLSWHAFHRETSMEQAGFPGACTFREITTVWGHGTGTAGVWVGAVFRAI